MDKTIKVQTVMFDEDSANSAQSDREIRVYHTGDTLQRLSKGTAKHGDTYNRNYAFKIEIAIKNIRTDDEIQNTADRVFYGLLRRRISNLPIIIESIENQGKNTNSIWKYIIKVVIPLVTNADTIDSCLFDEEAFNFNEVSLDLFPSYSDPLIPESNIPSKL